MSKQIDERVLKMEFDNKQFESNVQTSMSTLDKLKKALKLDGAEKGLSSVNAAAKKVDFSPMGSAIESVKVKFSALEVMAVTALANITNSAINAGKNLVKSFTIEPIKTGLDEYETKINSIQTIMSNTASKGTKMEDVTRVINELNTYADKTIYNFSEMTRNIGTFTAAGVGLEESAAAIQGIANLAAASGSSSQQASTAMYQLSQALAAGTVKLMDWNSVVNAGMGGEKFQEALKATAREHGVAVDAIIKQEGSFRDSLQKGWITADILNETLNKFTVDGAKKYAKSMMESGKWTQAQADALIKEAQSMEDAATKVKTFTQLMDTLKESAQSGWGQSWEIIIGNFEEAKELWTQVSDVIGGMINDSADARNKILQGWKDMGGRKDLIDGIANAFNALMAIIKPIKEAFSEIFPPATAEQLVAITRKFKEFTEGLKISDETAAKIKSTFKGLFAGLDIGVSFIKSVISGIVNLIGHLTGLSGGILDITGSFGDWIVNLRNSIKEANVFETAIGAITNVIDGAIDKIKAFGSAVKSHLNFEAVGSAFSKIAGGIGNAIKSITSALSGVFGNGNASKFLDIFNKGTIGIILLQIAKGIKNITKSVGESNGIVDNIKEILSGVSGAIKDFQEGIKIKNLKQIAIALAILAGSLWLLSSIDPNRLTGALISMTVLFGELMGAMEIFSRMNLGNSKELSSLSFTMIKMAAAVFILASALKQIAGLSSAQIVKGLFGITVMLGELVIVSKLLSSDKTQQIAKGAGQLILMSVALKIMASACKDLGSLSVNQLIKGIGGIGALLLEFVGFQALMSRINPSSMISSAIAMTIIAASMNIFADAASKFGSMSLKGIGKSLAAFGGILLEFVGFSALLNTIGASGGSAIAASIALIAIAAAMEIFADVAGKFGSMDWGELGKAGAAMGSVLALCAAFSAIGLMGPGIIAAGITLIAIAAAMEIFADVAGKFGSMDWEQLAKAGAAVGGLLALCAAFSAIGLMGPMIIVAAGALLIMAAAMAVFAPVLMLLGNMSWESIGKGLLALTGAIVVLGGAAVVLGLLSPLLMAAGAALVVFGAGCALVGAGVLMLSTGLIGLSAAVAAAGGSIRSVIEDFAAALPALMTGIGEGFVALITAIGDSAGQLTESFAQIIVSICDAIIKSAPKLVEAGVTIVMALLDGLNTVVPKAVEVGINLIISFLNTISARIGEAIQAGIDLAISFINGLADGIRNNHEAVGAAIENLISACVDAAISFAGRFLRVGVESVQKIANGISQTAQKAASAIRDVIQRCVDAASNTATALYNAGVNLIQGFINGIKSKIGEAWGAISSGVQGVIDKAKSILHINSPSKVFIGIGGSVIEGLAKGINKNSKWSENAAVSMAKGIITATEKTLDINSPSKVMIQEGKYVVQGIAEGITKEMSAEEAAEKKAENIISAFKKVFDRFDLKINLSSAKLDLWKTQHPNATASELDAQELETIIDQIPQLLAKKNAAVASYNKLKELLDSTTDEASREAITYKMIEAETEAIKLSKELEEATYKRAQLQKQVSIDPFIEVIDKLSGSIEKLNDVQEINGLQFKLWDTQFGDTATDAQKAARVVAELSLELNTLGDKTRMAREQAVQAALAYGESSEEAIKYRKEYLKLVDEALSKNKELKSAEADVDKVIKSNYEKRRYDYQQWIKENQKAFLDSGYSMEQVLETARNITGFDPSQGVDEFMKQYRNSLHDMTADGGLLMEIPVELKVTPNMDTIDTAATERISDIFSDAVHDGVTTVVSGTGYAIASAVNSEYMVVDGAIVSVAEHIAAQSDTYKSAGEKLGESLITGIQMGLAYTDSSGITRIIDFDELRSRYQGDALVTLGDSGLNPRASYDAARAANSPSTTNNEINVDNSDVVNAIDNLTGRVNMLGEEVGNLKVYMDTGALVGQIAPAVDRQLGMTAAMKERG